VRLFVTGLGRALAPPRRTRWPAVRIPPAPPGTRGFGLDVRDEAAVAAALAETRPRSRAPRSPRILDALG
jgi:hypothetical protein